MNLVTTHIIYTNRQGRTHRFAPTLSLDLIRVVREICVRLFLLLLDLGPRIFQRHREVEDQMLRRRLDVGAEVTLPLKLEAIAGLRARQATFDLTAVQHRQRIGIEATQEAFLARFGIRSIE